VSCAGVVTGKGIEEQLIPPPRQQHSSLTAEGIAGPIAFPGGT